MNIGLTALATLVISGVALNEFQASQAEELAEANVSAMTSAQAEQAYELSKAYGFDHTPAEAWDHWYGDNDD